MKYRVQLVFTATTKEELPYSHHEVSNVLNAFLNEHMLGRQPFHVELLNDAVMEVITDASKKVIIQGVPGIVSYHELNKRVKEDIDKVGLTRVEADSAVITVVSEK